MHTTPKLLTPLALAMLIVGCSSTIDGCPTLAVATHGVISDIVPVHEEREKMRVSTRIGGLGGGVIGHQPGGESGNDIATVAGAIGGAATGYQIEKSASQQVTSRIKVRFEHGGYQTITQSAANLRIGDRVNVDGNQVSRDQ